MCINHQPSPPSLWCFLLQPHLMLHLHLRHLHPPSATDAGMRDVAITTYLIRGVDDHHTTEVGVSQYSTNFSEIRKKKL